MKFLVDAQLPKRLARFLEQAGYDTVHTQDLQQGNATPDTDINEITVEKLPFDQQEMLLEILKRRHIEIRREAIAAAAAEAQADFRAGRLKFHSSVDEMMAELKEHLDEPEE